MLGKTNIIYVAKDQGSDMQFVTETVITRSSSDIVKIKYVNGTFFAFTEDDHILYGKNILELDFLQRDGKPLNASDMEYYNGKYVFINTHVDFEISGGNDERKVSYMVSENLSEFEDYAIPLVYGTSIAKIVGVAIDSYNKIVFLIALCSTYSSVGQYQPGTQTKASIGVYASHELIAEGSFELQIQRENTYTIGRYCCKSAFMRDRFFFYSNVTDTDDGASHSYCVTLDAVVKEASDQYYPIGIIDNMAYFCIGENTYYTLNFENHIKVRSEPTSCCISIGGLIGLYNEGTLELASKVNDFLTEKSTKLEITGIGYKALCFVDAGEYTYLGCEGGIIIQCLLDTEGMYQAPEITLIKTLSAKQALSQAQKYTDEKIAELKGYIDERLG